MAIFPSFAAAALPWQSFYMLVGEAAATLVGLMFIAVTFGSQLVTEESAPLARAFLDPAVSHFVQILLTACLVTVPTMSPRLFGALLLTMAVLRLAALFRIYGHMRRAQQTANDIELSDWLTGMVLPVLCYVLLGAAGIGFFESYAVAFNALAVVTIAILLIGVYGAWELMVWMAIVRSRTK
jgi:hypothetical protein